MEPLGCTEVLAVWIAGPTGEGQEGLGIPLNSWDSVLPFENPRHADELRAFQIQDADARCAARPGRV